MYMINETRQFDYISKYLYVPIRKPLPQVKLYISVHTEFFRISTLVVHTVYIVKAVSHWQISLRKMVNFWMNKSAVE